MADRLLPALCIKDKSVVAKRQQCILVPTDAAREALKVPKKSLSVPPACMEEKTALQEAKRRCRQYSAQPTEVQYLGQLVLTFGKYTNKTFKWLLENDVGYVKFLVDKHLKDVRNTARKVEVRDRWLKDSLLKYVNHFPPVSSHLEVNIDSCTYGHGRFKDFTYKEMWEWYKYHKVLEADQQLGTAQDRKMAKEAFLSIRQWLRLREEDITSRPMKRFRQYILGKEKASTDKKTEPARTDVQPSTSTFSPADHDPTWDDDTDLIEAVQSMEATEGQ
ncbi:uncharacterized protein LOC118405149 [Branchiostoma floridae]|uniref:Uncharacterized protein LOC118405149 n=1 Tax=Branchiostoma floridae TaxID=7739 RepID=A0A9J7HNF3_BRAFL|nr:uncharacterized protein LOC118405149 [Branchiostoma floridae]